MEFTELEAEEVQRLEKQLAVVDELAHRLDLPELSGTLDDLQVLQAILDSAELDADQTYELQCLGVAFGQVLAAEIDGLGWAIVHDEYGSDPTLRYRHTTLCINALTMISKRVEDGLAVNVLELFEGLRDTLQRAIQDMGGSA